MEMLCPFFNLWQLLFSQKYAVMWNGLLHKYVEYEVRYPMLFIYSVTNGCVHIDFNTQ